MRVALAIQLCVALLLSLAEAPFFHIHEENTGHHQGLVTHTHVSAHRSTEQTGIDSADNEPGAKELNWFQLKQPAPRPAGAVLTTLFSFEVPLVVGARVHRERPRIHGPPTPVTQPSRAPPPDPA